MSSVTLVSSGKHPLKPLIQSALESEVRLIESGLQKSQARLSAFEEKYGLLTQVFLQKYRDNQLEETLDFDEWIGEHRMLERLQEKALILRELRFAD